MLLILLPTVRFVLQVAESSKQLNRIECKKQSIRILQHYLVLLLSGLAALSVFKIASSGSPETLRTTLVGPLNEKLMFLIKQAIPTQINFQRTPWDGLPVLGFVCLAIIITSITVMSLQLKTVLPILLFLGGAIGSLAPNFLTAENWASSRSLLQGQWFYASLTLISVIHLILFISRYSRVITALFSIGIAFFSIFQSNQTLDRELRTPQLRELNAARIEISKLDPNSTIFVVKSSWTASLAPWVRADEFGIPSTAGAWVPVPLTKLILAELYGDRDFDVQLVDETDSTNQINFLMMLEEIKSK
jgi:hypothetical protein